MVSIVMAYLNRRREIINTLDSIKPYQVDNMEVIIVDDGSVDEHSIDDLVEKYDFTIKLIKINRADKKHINPCIPYNIGFRNVKNDIVIIQNPECYHVGNVIGHTIKNINNQTYLNYSCYNISSKATEELTNNSEDFFKNFTPQPFNSDTTEGNIGWFNHPQHRAVGYHFCSAISKNNLDEMNGFDERFANGIGWDDTEFYFRVSYKGLKFNIIEEPYVIHQYHYYDDKFKSLDVNKLSNLNRMLLNTTINQRKIRVNENSYYGHRD